MPKHCPRTPIGESTWRRQPKSNRPDPGRGTASLPSGPLWDDGAVSESTTHPARPLAELSEADLTAFLAEQQAAYADLLSRGLKLDLTRGKPAPAQLDLSDALLTLPTGPKDADGVDTRNYGGLEGIRELREIFADLLRVEVDQIVAGGNSSLVMMREVLTDLWLKGGVDSERPWSAEEKVTFICPVPGYDRHFTLLDWFGIETVTVPMNDDGPDAEGENDDPTENQASTHARTIIPAGGDRVARVPASASAARAHGGNPPGARATIEATCVYFYASTTAVRVPRPRMDLRRGRPSPAEAW